MTLGLLTYDSIPASAPVQPEKRRNPLLALLLSLLFPGIGHLYLRLWRQAGWLICLELLCLLAIAGGGQFHANAVIAVPSLYLFAVIDAYFSAREWNAGVTEWLKGANPRITAILNLLTKGFGYFYLGDRGKGIICFLAIAAVQGALLLHTNIWTTILAISLQIAVAMDGYRVARERLSAEHPELYSAPSGESDAKSLIDAANPGKLNPAFAMGFFAVLGTAMFIGYATMMALNGHAVKSNGTLERGPAGLTYIDPQEGIEMTVPEDWSMLRTADTLTHLQGDGLNIMIQEQFATYTVDNLLDETEKSIRARHAAASFSPVTAKVAGRSASGFDVSFDNSEGVEIHQRVSGLRRGLKIFLLIETWNHPKNRAILDKIEQGIRLK
jgi:hypothetical protein